jgi:hypothetical protein
LRELIQQFVFKNMIFKIVRGAERFFIGVVVFFLNSPDIRRESKRFLKGIRINIVADYYLMDIAN